MRAPSHNAIDFGTTNSLLAAANEERVFAPIPSTRSTTPLARAGVRPADVDIVCQTGGTARVPRIARALRARLGAERLRELGAFHSVIGELAERARDRARRGEPT